MNRIDIIAQNGNDGEHYKMSTDEKSRYYDQGGIETIDIIRAKLTKEQFEGYLLGNALKYTCRVNWKTPEDRARDSEKAAIYIKWFRDIICG